MPRPAARDQPAGQRHELLRVRADEVRRSQVATAQVPAEERQARAGALALALRREAISNYGGIRIDSQGRRFRIEGARLWTLRNEAGEACGQAACFESWWWL